MSTHKVLCKLPHGVKIEMGLELDHEAGTFRRLPNYRALTLKGTNSNLVALSSKIGAVAERNIAPGVTDVTDDELSFVEAWLAKNAKLSFVKAGTITIQKSADVKAASADLRKMDLGFEPLDPSQMPHGIEKAIRE